MEDRRNSAGWRAGLTTAIVCLAGLVCPVAFGQGQGSPAAGGASSAPAGDKAGQVSFPYAGVALTMPAGFQRQRPGPNFEVARAVRCNPAGEVVAAATLAAIPLQAKTSLEEFVKTIMAESTTMLAVKDMKVLEAESLTVDQRPALRRRISYTVRGTPSVADRVFVLVDVPGQQAFKLGYLLTLETGPDTLGQIDAACKTVVESIKFSVPVHPASGPVKLGEKPLALPGGFAVKVPDDWKVQASGAPAEMYQLEAFQFDYLLGGLPYPRLTVSVLRLRDPATTAKDIAQQGLAEARKVLAEDGYTTLEEGPSELAKTRAYQIVSRITPEGRSLISVQRIVLHEGHSYTLSMAMETDKPEQVKALLDVFAATFAFQPMSAPATAPATAPAASATLNRSTPAPTGGSRQPK